jgi:lysophospholipase L1-like esterase
MKMKEFQQLDIFDKIVLVGDSQVEFFKASYSDFEFVNLGISGERINGLCARLPSILREKPKEIILLIGINDILGNKSIEQITSLFTKLLAILNKHDVIFKVIEIIHVGDTKNQFNPQITEVNKMLHSLTSPDNMVPPTGMGIFSDDMILDSKYSDDGLHLNELGYSRLNNIIFSEIQLK